MVSSQDCSLTRLNRGFFVLYPVRFGQSEHYFITRCLNKLSFTDLSISRLDLPLRAARPWNFFSNFLLRLGRIKRSLVTYMRKYGPKAPNFVYDFWAQFIASQETIFSLKIVTKITCHFPICTTWECLLLLSLSMKRTKNNL